MAAAAMASVAEQARDVQLPLAVGEASVNEHPTDKDDMKGLLGRPWADNFEFYLDFVAISLVGAVMGFASIPYMWVVDEVSDWWLKKLGPADFMEKASTLDFMAGSPWWILVCWLGCTGVGILKAVIGLDQYPSFITELKHQAVDPWQSAKICLTCMASLCAGAVLGPEAGLGGTGSAFGYIACILVNRSGLVSQDPERMDDRRRAYILSGMSAAFGSILPAPFVAVLLVGEIASLGTETNGDEEFMAGRKLPNKVMVFLVPAATFAFAARYITVDLPSSPFPAALLPYDKWSPLIAIGLGVLGAVAGLIFLILNGITKAMYSRLGSNIERCLGAKARIVLVASLAGALVGVVTYLFPLCVGSGRSQMKAAIKHGPELGTWVLVGTAFGKALAYWLSANGGLVGGIFFPAMFLGMLVGDVCSRLFDVKRGEAVLIMLGAVPGSFVTAPLTMLSLPVGMFVTGPLHTIGIFMGITVSNTCLVGTGLLLKLLERAARRRSG